MYRTRPNLRLASTKRGMRRILKYQGPVNEYIRQAVLAGTYRTTEELERVKKERRESADDLQTIMRRFRQDIVRGSAITDYPIEYLILQSHPPVPDPPRLNRKLERQMKEPPSPLAKLVQKHLKQHGDDGGSRTAPVGHRSTEEYYRHLLGVAAPSTQTALGNKTAQVQKAYAKAVKQYELMRVDGLSEADAMLRVDDLLEEQARNEKTMSTQRVKAAQAFRERVGPEFKIHNMAWEAKAEIDQQEQRRASNTANDSSENAAEEPFLGATQNFELLASVFANDATKIQGLMRWSERLAAVPYTEWTIGASTALDHWMARQLLGMSEETWATLLEGDSPDLLAQGRDLVRLRETLFPETILEAPDSIVDESEEEAPAVEEEDPAEKSIEELLASLGGLKTSGETGGNRKKPSSSSWSWLEDLGSADLDVRIDRFVEQLQDWRYRNVQTPYNEWPQPDQNEFSEWLKEFVESVSSDAERGTIDYVATRKALLSSPPVDREQAGAFWSNLQHDTQAISLLDAMRADGPPPGASILHAAFWDLPYDTQLECLLNLGALRPILDEYTKESDRLAFLHRFGDIVLAGVELEHLVPDPDGPVTTADLSPATVEEMKIHPSSRFRLEKRPYMSESNIAADEKSRALFHAWNQHKAGRARYEEKLFQTGRLGLRYSDRIPRHDEFPEEEKK